MTFSEVQFRRYEQHSALLEAHGYFVCAEPIPGMEEVFLDDLKAACAKVEETAAFLRKRWGYRGLSRRLLEDLNVTLRMPSSNVDSALLMEITAKENRGR